MKEIYLSKTDFIEYLQCQKNFWLKKKRPELYNSPIFTDFEKSKIKEGYKVEEYAHKLFPGGLFLDGGSKKLAQKTKELIFLKKSPIFQATFISDNNLLAKVDILAYNKKSDSWDIYEVKSSTKIKTDRKHNNIKDASFQKFVLEETGIKVGDVFIVHLNKDYKRLGKINVVELFSINNINEEIKRDYDLTKQEIIAALALLERDEISLTSCPCLSLTKNNHCSSFKVFNPGVPDYSVHNISRIGSKKLEELTDSGIFEIKDIPENFKLTEKQQLQVDLEKFQKPKINRENIRNFINQLNYPLYFIDYETYSSAIPVLDNISPHQHIPFQASIHILDLDGKLTHFEYLARTTKNTIRGLIEFMKKTISSTGTLISWHASFENSKNKEMAEIYPEHSQFLFNLNSRTLDLEVVFKNDYLIPEFKGRTSIKVVLPALLPKFSYQNLDIQSGEEAMEKWGELVFKNIREKEKQKIVNNLLEYCKMDTLAMVEIFKHLDNL